jgi:hypothetical protein
MVRITEQQVVAVIITCILCCVLVVFTDSGWALQAACLQPYSGGLPLCRVLLC